MPSNKKSSLKLTLCMVNYNGEQYLEESLGSVFVRTEKFYEVFLIDNASEDKSLEIIRDRFPNVKVIQLDKNLGPAAARNVGFKAASCDRILFMDNDVILTPHCPNQLTQALNDNPDAAVAMPRVLYANNRNTIQYDGAESHFLGMMSLHNANRPIDKSKERTKKIGSLVTACFLIDCKRWNGNVLFDEDFFMWFEDHDLGIRTRSMGHEILSVPPALCYHREGTEGVSIRVGGKYSKLRVFYLIRNRWLLILKNYELKTLLILSPILFLYEIFQLAGVIKKGWFLEWIKAYSWIAFHPVMIYRKRKFIQYSKNTPDRDILSNGPIPFREQDLLKNRLERTCKNFLDRISAFYWAKIERFI